MTFPIKSNNMAFMGIERISYVPEANVTDKSSAAPIDINNPIELKQLAMSALVEIVQTAPRNVSLVSAIRELIDRIEGKAPQSIALDVKDTRMDKMPIDRLLKLAAMLDEPVIIAPMPQLTGE